MKILLIEDNELNLDMLTRRLERKGFTVISAADGLSGIEKANQEKPKLIIMDLSLPILNGWDAAKKLSFPVNDRDVLIEGLGDLRVKFEGNEFDARDIALQVGAFPIHNAPDLIHLFLKEEDAFSDEEGGALDETLG